MTSTLLNNMKNMSVSLILFKNMKIISMLLNNISVFDVICFYESKSMCLFHHQEHIFYHQKMLNDILFMSFVPIACKTFSTLFILCLTTFLPNKTLKYS